MPTTFLALQCYKCSMMQVKHEKKSSNKWICSLCNEKQSVRKVYATSMAAKDIRNFVQEYNFSRNDAQDRALAEFVLNEEAGNAEDLQCGSYSESRCDILSDGCSHLPQKIVENKWNEYLPQDEGNHAEASEDTMDDHNFVTTMPEMCAKKLKGRVRPALSETYPLQQKQRRSNEKFSNRFSKNFSVGLDASQKENALPHFWSRKVPFSSSLQMRNTAKIQHGETLSAYKVLQRNPEDMPEQANAAGRLLGGNVFMPQSSFEVVVASKKWKSHAVVEPKSRYRTYSDKNNQEAFASVKQEQKVSKWARYMDSNELMSEEKGMPSFKHATDGQSILDAHEGPRQSKEGLSIWLLRAASNLEYANGLVKTEVDELLNAPCLSLDNDGCD